MKNNRSTGKAPEAHIEQAKPSGAGAWSQTSKGGFWGRLPLANQLLFAASLGCLGMGALALAGPPVVEGTQSAVFPYTSAGKRQTCLSNMENLSRALSLYAQDSDGRLPSIEAASSSKARVTWVTLARPYVERESSSSSVWSCPAGSISGGNDSSSYGLNPILAGGHLPQGEDAANVLMLSDRGQKHDLSLLPPVPGWNSVSSSLDASATNLDFRHDGEAAVLFADGHTSTLSPSGATPVSLWGGGSAIEAGLKRVGERSGSSGAFVKRLQDGDVAGVAQLLQAQPKALETSTADLLALWKMNWQEDSGAPATLASSDLEEMGWHLARAQEKLGQSAPRVALDAETKRRIEEEHKRVDAAGYDIKTSATGVRLDVPRGWAWSEENKDRYHTAYARSPLPGLWASVEKGDRTSFSATTPVDWCASEKRLQTRYGQGYKRLRMEGATLLGRPAGLWEYELEKPGSPRLHKRYVGTADGWNSYVLSLTAPANDFEAWKGDFDRITGSLSLS